MKFSVLISVYHKENPVYLEKALTSLENQTLLANEIVLVKDGPLTEELDSLIDKHKKSSPTPYKIVELKENEGLGLALKKGLEVCQYPWIARMDSDDIAMGDRFEKQVSYLKAFSNIDILGSWIAEFNHNPEIIDGIRKLPTEHDEILQYAKYRNPLNHMTVFFRKNAVIKAGSYQPMNGFEDYYLWIRMILDGAIFANISEVLVKARTGNDMISRRHGLGYVQNEWKFLKAGWKQGFFSIYELIRNFTFRGVTRILPTFLLQKIYSFLRK